MSWPNDRKFVDATGNILDPWQRPLTSLAPLLKLTAADFATLQSLIRAAQEAEGDGTSIFELPIDTAPNFSTDFAVGFDASADDGRRYPLTLFQGSPVLISTTSFSGTEVSVAIPSGYRNIELRVLGMSVSSTVAPTIGFSEDAGATYLIQTLDIFRNGASQSGVSGTGDVVWKVGALNAANSAYGRMTLFDYGSSLPKLTNEDGIELTAGVGWTGTRYMESTSPINAATYKVGSGAFDAGTVELWGMP